MIEVTERAVEKIKESLQNQTEYRAIRIFLQDKNSKRPFLRLFFDNPRNDDAVVTEQGITFAVEKELLEMARPIRIDYAETDDQAGFQVLSRLPMVGWKRR